VGAPPPQGELGKVELGIAPRGIAPRGAHGGNSQAAEQVVFKLYPTMGHGRNGGNGRTAGHNLGLKVITLIHGGHLHLLSLFLRYTIRGREP